MNIPILYEDNHLLIVEKPVNIPVQEDQSKDKDLLTLLKEDIKVRHKKPGNVFLALVHRLDRPVGGAMVSQKLQKPLLAYRISYEEKPLSELILLSYMAFHQNLRINWKII